MPTAGLHDIGKGKSIPDAAKRIPKEDIEHPKKAAEQAVNSAQLVQLVRSMRATVLNSLVCRNISCKLLSSIGLQLVMFNALCVAQKHDQVEQPPGSCIETLLQPISFVGTSVIKLGKWLTDTMDMAANKAAFGLLDLDVVLCTCCLSLTTCSIAYTAEVSSIEHACNDYLDALYARHILQCHLSICSLQDMLSAGKDLCAALTMSLTVNQHSGLCKANWASFGVAVVGWGLIQAQKSGSAPKEARNMLVQLATLVLQVRYTS